MRTSAFPSAERKLWRRRVGLVVAIGLLQLPYPALADAWPPLAPPSLAGKPAAPTPAEGLRPSRSPEAEPSDEDPHYARICHSFGEGFTYSPGTGACIKIGGYAKFGTSFGGRNSLR